MWLVFCIIVIFIDSIVQVIDKHLATKDALRLCVLSYIIYSMFNISLGFLLNPNTLFKFSFINFMLLLPVSLFSAFGYYCAIQSYKYTNMSVSIPIFNTKIIWILILSTIFLDDRLSIIQIILILIIIMLNILLNVKKSNKSTTTKGVLYALGFLFLNGTSVFLNKIIMVKIKNPIDVTFYNGVTGIIAILLLVVFLKRIDLLDISKTKHKPLIMFDNILDVIAAFLLRYSYIDGNVTIITALTSGSMILAIILSAIVLKEKITYKRWLAIICVTLSLIGLSIVSI